MTSQEALEYISDGHTFWTVERAKEVCKALKVPFNENLIDHYKGQKDANPDNEPKGLWLNEDKPVDGVNALRLSNYIKHHFGLEAGGYIGRGSQAQANAEAVKKHLGL